MDDAPKRTREDDSDAHDAELANRPKRSNSHLTKADHAALLDLCLDMNQRQVSRTSTARATASNDAVPRRRPLGRNALHVPQPDEYVEIKLFLETVFRDQHLSVSDTTARNNIRGKPGFRLGDFGRFPVDRTTHDAIAARFDFAMAFDEKTLAEGIYVDTMYLSKGDKRRAWAVVDDTTRDIHMSLVVAASPSVGAIHYEIRDGLVGAADIRAFVEGAVL